MFVIILYKLSLEKLHPTAPIRLHLFSYILVVQMCSSIPSMVTLLLCVFFLICLCPLLVLWIELNPICEFRVRLFSFFSVPGMVTAFYNVQYGYASVFWKQLHLFSGVLLLLRPFFNFTTAAFVYSYFKTNSMEFKLIIHDLKFHLYYLDL